MNVYYGHSLLIYDTEREKEELNFIKKTFPTSKIINPNTDIPWKGDMDIYLEKVRFSDLIIISEYLDHIGHGVFDEIKTAIKHNISVKCLRKDAQGFVLLDVKDVEVYDADDWKINYGTVIIKRIELIPIIQAYFERKSLENKEFHIHPDGRRGGSGTGVCKFKGGFIMSEKQMPKKEGLRAETGGMTVGTLWHDRIIQPILEEYYNSEKWDSDLVLATEVYVEVELVKGLLNALSPIDVALIKTEKGKPAIIEVEKKFKNITTTIKMKHPDAKWIRIWDLKSADNAYAYWKYLENHEENNSLSFIYESQGFVYMRGSGLSEITFLFVNKGNLKMFEHTVKWSDDKWNTIVDHNKRMYEIGQALAKNKDIEYIPDDFVYITSEEDDFECRYCGLSEAHDDFSRGKKGTTILDKPCEHACKFIRKDALEKFHIRDKFKRGSSHITIINIDGEDIIAQNKSGKVFKDTIYYALRNYKKM